MSSIGSIDTGRIEAMLAQIKSAAAGKGVAPDAIAGALGPVGGAAKPANFADALKASLDSVNEAQVSSNELGKRFTMGDDSVSLSDVMISTQKASIAFQATVQVRNKLVSAYHDIMNMQV